MAAAVQRHRHAIGWSVAIAILLNGWLPILFQAALVAAEAEAHGASQGDHADHASAEHAQHADHAEHAHHARHADGAARSAPTPASKAPECPVLHSAVCLCAVLVKVLPAPAATAPQAAATTGRVRVRLPTQRPSRQVRTAPFEARAPPSSDRAQNPT